MDLSYKILWIEDSEDWMNAAKQGIKDIFDNLALDLEILPYHSYSIFESDLISDSIDLKSFDLMLVDYNLSGKNIGNDNGNTLISKIRAKEVYSEILFYSLEGEDILRQKVSSDKLEGVYIADRATGFDTKVNQIILYTIRRIQDLKFLRGFVVAEVSELEHFTIILLKELLKEEHHTNFEQQCITLKKKSKDDLSEKIKDIEKIATSNISDILKLLDGEQKYRAIHRLKEKIISEGINQVLNDNISKHIIDVEKYKKEILKVRNLLAHVKEIQKENGEKVLQSIINNEEILIDENMFIQIRKDIKYHKTLLSELIKSISN